MRCTVARAELECNAIEPLIYFVDSAINRDDTVSINSAAPSGAGRQQERQMSNDTLDLGFSSDVDAKNNEELCNRIVSLAQQSTLGNALRDKAHMLSCARRVIRAMDLRIDAREALKMVNTSIANSY
jgi:hypothetical protein